MPQLKPTIGESVHNGFNLKDEQIPWEGLVGHDEHGLCQFADDAHGLRAGMIDIHTKFKKDGLRTIGAIIEKYAPPDPDGDKNPTIKYATFIGRGMGFPAYPIEKDNPNDLAYTLDLDDVRQLYLFGRLQIHFEQGRVVYSQQQILLAADEALKRGYGAAELPKVEEGERAEPGDTPSNGQALAVGLGEHADGALAEAEKEEAPLRTPQV